MTAAEEVLAAALARPPTLGAGRLVCVDGPSGSGKSTLARQVAALADAVVVHTDDLCPGWDGIPALPEILRSLVDPLADGRPGRAPRYDWIRERPAEDVVVAPCALLVLEGVGAGTRLLLPRRTLLVWTDATPGVRRTRALERDGDTFAPYWDAWARSEEAFYAAEQVEAAADLSLRTG